MKKIFTLLVMVALAACWTSCADDDDKNEPDPTIPTMNEIILSIETGSHPIKFFKPDYIGEFGEEWEEEILPYIQVPQDLEINWGDGQTTNSTTHQYEIEGTYQITIKGTNLTSFIFENEQVKNIDVTKAPNLVVLSLYLNEINKLDISKNTNLTYLMCTNNELSSLDISNNLTLKLLDCSDNNPFSETSFKELLNDLPNRNNSSKGYLYIDNPNNWDVSTAENKGWQVN